MRPTRTFFRFAFAFTAFLFFAGLVNCASAASSVPKHIEIFFSADTTNELFVCGCKDKLGGLSRRKTAIKRSQYPHVVVECGEFSKGSTRLEKLKTETLLKCYNNIGYDVINLGGTEQRLGRELMNRFDSVADAPFISANIADEKGKLIYPPYKIITRDGLKLGFLGVTSSAFLNQEVKLGYMVLDIEKQVAKYVPELDKQCDLLIVLASARDNEMESIATKYAQVDMVLGGRTFNYSENDRPTKVAKTIVHKTGSIGKYLGRLRLDLKQSKPVSISNYEGYNIQLGEDLPDDPSIEKILDEHRRVLKTTDFTKPESDTGTAEPSGERSIKSDGAKFEKPDIENEVPAYRSFTSAVRCEECHPEIYAKWKQSRHADAFLTLVNEQAQDNPQCFPCHSVGFKRIGGFIDYETTPELAGVQCENCHGGGAAHVLAMVDESYPGPAITRTVPDFFCLRCHNEEWDPGFSMDKKFPIVDHGPDNQNEIKSSQPAEASTLVEQ